MNILQLLSWQIERFWTGLKRWIRKHLAWVAAITYIAIFMFIVLMPTIFGWDPQ